MVHLCLSVESIQKFRDSARLIGTGFHFCKRVKCLHYSCQHIFQFDSPKVHCFLQIVALILQS